MPAVSTFQGRPRLRAGVVLLGCVLVLGACRGGGEGGPGRGKNGEAKAPEAIPVEVATVARRPISASYSGTAPLEARAESQVVAKTSGVALSVLVEEGQLVRAGQVLTRLDASRATLQAAQTAAQVRKLQANYERSRQLASQKLISANDLDQLKYDLENARAANRLANLEVSYANVVAPISGVIAERKIKPGNFVQINTPIFRIVDTSKLEATLNVPERELATLKPGMDVDLQVDALPGRTFAGSIDRIAPVVDAGSGTFRVITAFDSGGLLQPGMFGRIGIDHDQRTDALVVPRTALLEDEGAAAVFAVRDNKAVRVPVTLGYTDGQWVEVTKGLKAGEQVVTAGKVALREGSAVQVVGGAAAGEAAKQVAANGNGAATPSANSAR
jgi:membrane fusion protein (multidrug efflux system)